MGHFPYLEWLTRIYKNKALETGHQKHYLQAIGLANACVERESTEERLGLVYEIETQWYNGKHPLTYDEHQKTTARHKQRRADLRDDVKHDLNTLSAKLEALDIEHLYREETLNQAHVFAQNVFDMSKKSNNCITHFFHDILEGCRGVMHDTDLTAPCPFAVIGLGPVARGETTSCSSLEYAYIVDSDTDIEYFRKLDVEINFRIASLGETSLSAFHIKELDDMTDCMTDNEESAGAVGNDSKFVGFGVHGIRPQAVQGADLDGRLILTVDGMVSCYLNSLLTIDDDQADILSQFLSSTILMYCSVRGQQLHDLLLSGLAACSTNEAALNQLIKEKRYDDFTRYIESCRDKFSLPEFKLVNHTELMANSAVEMSTYIVGLIDVLRKYESPEICFHWDFLHKLCRRGIVSGDNYRSMNILLAVSLFMLASMEMIPKPDFLSESKDSTVKPHQEPDKTSKILVSLLIPLQKSLHSGGQEGDSSLKFSTFVCSMVKDSFVSQADYMYHVEVMLFARNYKCALNQLYNVFGAETVNNCRIFIETMCTKYLMDKSDPLIRKHARICFLIFLSLGKYTQAEEYMKCLAALEQNSLYAISQWQTFAVKCAEARKCKEAVMILEQLLLVVQERLRVHESDSLTDFLCEKLVDDIRPSTDLLNQVRLVIKLHEALEKSYNDLLLDGESIKHLETVLKLLRSIEEGDFSYEGDIHILTNRIGMRHHSMHNHSKSLPYYTETLNILKSIHGENESHREIAICYNNVGKAYSDLGKYTEAVEFLNKSLNMRQALYGQNTGHEEIAHSLADVGRTCCHMGEYDKALVYHSKALEMRKALYGEDSDHDGIATSHNHMANVYHQIGDYTTALEHFNKSLKIWKVLKSDANHSDIAGVYNNIANVYFSMQRYEKTVKIYNKALAIWKNCYGENLSRPYIALGYSNIGGAYKNMGEYQRALEYHRMALQIRQQLYGEDANHPDIIGSYSNIGFVYSDWGKYAESLKYLRKSLNMTKALYDEDTAHPSIAASYSEIGYLYSCLGKYAQSLQCLTKSLNMWKALYGVDKCHSRIANNYEKLGMLYCDTGEYTKSLEYYAKALSVKKALYKTDHPALATVYNNLGYTYLAMGQYTKSLEAHTKSLGIKKTLYGDGTDNVDIARSFSHIGSVYSGTGDHELSATYHTKALGMLKRLYGDDADHPLVATIYTRLGTQYSKMGQYTRSMVCLNKALDMRLALYGDTDHKDIADSYRRMGELYSDKEEYNQSLEYHTKSQNMLKVLYGESTDHPHIADGYSKLGNVYSDMGEHDKSLEYHTRSLDMKRALYGHVIIHPSIATTLHDMANMYSNMAVYKTSLEYHIKSLLMRRVMYGEDSNHTDIAECYRRMGRVIGDLGYPIRCHEYLGRALKMHEAVHQKHLLMVGNSFHFQ